MDRHTNKQMRAARNAAEPTFGQRVARKLSRILYRVTGIADELKTNPYNELHYRARCLYIHIPKTGGNSVTQMIYGVPSHAIGGHTPARTFLEYSPELFASYFVFATVRDPFDRLRSSFHYLKTGGMSRNDRKWSQTYLARIGNFRTFVQALDCDVKREKLLSYVHFKPQSDYLCDASGKQIVNHLVRMENFAAEMRAVCERIGVKFSDDRYNVTEAAGHREDEATPDLKAIVRRIYSKDYEMLGYEAPDLRMSA